MSSTLIEKAANSGPSARDYEQQRRELLTQADAAASAAAAIDTDAAVAMSLERNSVAADDALQRVSAWVQARGLVLFASRPRRSHSSIFLSRLRRSQFIGAVPTLVLLQSAAAAMGVTKMLDKTGKEEPTPK